MKKFFVILAMLSMTSALFAGCVSEPVEETDFDLEEDVWVEEVMEPELEEEEEEVEEEEVEEEEEEEEGEEVEVEMEVEL